MAYISNTSPAPTRFTSPPGTVTQISGPGDEPTIVNDLTVTDTLTVTGVTTLSGGVVQVGAETVTSADASALAVGRQGATAPALKVDASAASSATGVEVVSAAAASGVNLRAISSGTNENLTINAKGSGTITIGPVSTGAVTITPATTVTGALTGSSSIRSTSVSGGVGYATGAGGTVTQATDKTTGVTLSKLSGAITLNNAALAAATIVSFVLTNTSIAVTDVLILNHISGGTVGSYTLNAQCAAGSATINVRNNTAGSLSEAIVIQFAVIKGVNA